MKTVSDPSLRPSSAESEVTALPLQLQLLTLPRHPEVHAQSHKGRTPWKSPTAFVCAAHGFTHWRSQSQLSKGQRDLFWLPVYWAQKQGLRSALNLQSLWSKSSCSPYIRNQEPAQKANNLRKQHASHQFPRRHTGGGKEDSILSILPVQVKSIKGDTARYLNA